MPYCRTPPIGYINCCDLPEMPIGALWLDDLRFSFRGLQSQQDTLDCNRGLQDCSRENWTVSLREWWRSGLHISVHAYWISLRRILAAIV